MSAQLAHRAEALRKLAVLHEPPWRLRYVSNLWSS
jgi:hypothetical protein